MRQSLPFKINNLPDVLRRTPKNTIILLCEPCKLIIVDPHSLDTNNHIHHTTQYPHLYTPTRP